MRFQLTAVGLACGMLLAGCSGGGGSSDGAKAQSISFPFVGGPTLAAPPEVATVQLTATASGGGEVTFTSNTPDICTVNGATLSLIKAGECSVTANQAGGNGYTPASENQIFGIPKRSQTVIFRNPGALPLNSTPVPLVATTSIAGKAVTFTSSTPTVCTVSGNTMTKVDNGLCKITAQVVDDIYAPGTVVRSIPIGTAQADALTFLSGYKSTDQTNESGSIETYAGSSADGWWCATNWCGRTVPTDGSSFTWYYNIQPDSGNGLGGYMGVKLLAGGLAKLVENGDTPAGARIDAQTALKFKLAQNPEWFGNGNNGVDINLYLGHFAVKDGKACNVKLHATVMPTAAAATSYSVDLKDKFTIAESCGLTGLDLWTELQDYPIAQVEFSAVSANASMATAGTDKLTYSTQLTLTGPITFQ
ncbi:hypothetical protein GPY61_12435 [Massilia sp. NEAU-DD11]|uniref:Uncharacterized protein n=1 Tax=Massilia cellulosiltytica TaxID=2683234 RepID=A0A7X3K7D6_9BURK|nr:hypothetical protein [Telluria cellulosilytica]MVW60738.1 hypothetical protein [Telluria cellulosilytica]